MVGCWGAGMDVVEIIRAFSDFVTSVSYSATPQGFLELPESSTNSRHLRTLTAQHVSQVRPAPAARNCDTLSECEGVTAVPTSTYCLTGQWGNEGGGECSCLLIMIISRRSHGTCEEMSLL